MKDFIWLLFHPYYWFVSDSFTSKQFCNKWDTIINHLLDNYEFTEIRECTAKLGNFVIWTANHPYASFNEYSEENKKLLPKVKTRHRAFLKLQKAQIKMTPTYNHELLYKNILIEKTIRNIK